MIKKEWEEYKTACYDGQAVSEVQERETRQAFYAGALAVFTVVGRVTNDDTSEEVAASKLDQIMDELIMELDPKLRK